jgi:hypothetical protein
MLIFPTSVIIHRHWAILRVFAIEMHALLDLLTLQSHSRQCVHQHICVGTAMGSALVFDQKQACSGDFTFFAYFL